MSFRSTGLDDRVTPGEVAWTRAILTCHLAVIRFRQRQNRSGPPDCVGPDGVHTSLARWPARGLSRRCRFWVATQRKKLGSHNREVPRFPGTQVPRYPGGSRGRACCATGVHICTLGSSTAEYWNYRRTVLRMINKVSVPWVVRGRGRPRVIYRAVQGK